MSCRDHQVLEPEVKTCVDIGLWTIALSKLKHKLDTYNMQKSPSKDNFS